MTAVRIDGKALAEKVRAQVADDVRAYGEPVCLATILVGDDPVSHVYVGSKHKASHEAGIESRDHRFPAETADDVVTEFVPVIFFVNTVAPTTVSWRIESSWITPGCATSLTVAV